MASRREFFKKGSLFLFSTLIAEKITANPYTKILFTEFPSTKPIRISGRVKSLNKGLKNVVVSDGMSVARTNGEGEFEILSNSQQRFISLSQPSGYIIEKSNKGTSKFYEKIAADKNGEMFVEFNLRESETSENEHSFFLLADPQTLDEEDMNLFEGETIPDLQKTLSEVPNPLFGISCGDLMFDNLDLLPHYEKAISKVGIPFFQVLGNHDVEIQAKTDEQSSRTFENFFGPAYYSFNKGEVHYVVLDDVFWFGSYIGYLTDKQLEWLKSDLEQIEKGKTVIVFAHIPPFTELAKRSGQPVSNSLIITNRELLYDLMQPYNAYIVCGHMHISEYLKERNINIHTCGAVCGAWWTGPICTDGTPKGYSIYNVKGSEIRWEYKSTGFNRDYQMKIYLPGSELNTSDEIIANIWAANNEWKVFWYEDGIKMGLAEKRNGFDPLATKLYSGSEIPSKHKWAEPSITDHLFYIKPVNKNSSVQIEAVDNFNRIFTQKVI